MVFKIFTKLDESSIWIDLLDSQSIISETNMNFKSLFLNFVSSNSKL